VTQPKPTETTAIFSVHTDITLGTIRESLAKHDLHIVTGAASAEIEQAQQLVLAACRELNVDRDGVGWTRSQLDAVIEAIRVWRDRLGLL
jgi:hypothetical protein